MRARLYLFVVLGPVLALGGAKAALAWTPATQVTIAREASRLAPGDLFRQIEKHRRAYEEGATAPFSDSDPGRHMKNADGSGQLDRVIQEEVARAIALIQTHQPFEVVVRQLGVVSHYVADANNPLATAATDGEEGRYFIDFLRYVEKTEPKFPLVFYGVRPGMENRADVSPLLAETFRRGRELYPLVGLEYRRIGFASGVGRFDDRSTAFGTASLSFSHAVTDVALVLRYIWIRAGGIDDRTNLPAGGTRLVVVPRAGSAR